MTFAELKTELEARGFDYLSDTRQGYFLNRAYHRVCDREPWPFLEGTATGTSPLTISDARAVLSVVSTTSAEVLQWEDIRTLRESDPSLSQSGVPYCWYFEGTDLTAYPSSSDTLSVRYIKVPTDLTNNSDEPVFPARYHYALVDGACTYAYRDSDNLEAASATEDEFEKAILEMTDSLLVVNYDSPANIVISGTSLDW